MSDEPKKPKSWFWFKAAIVAATVLYPLSFGPACWLVGMGWLPATPVGLVYFPIAGLLVFLGTISPQSFEAILQINSTATHGFFNSGLAIGLFQGG